MGKLTNEITEDLRSFIEAQPVFFVATAPLAADGHINVSPKGLDTFRVLGPRRVAYLDLTGSGNETAAHVTQNARMTMMFCSFVGRPLILRLYCRGRAVLPDAAEWPELIDNFPRIPGTRQILLGEVESVQTSCGFGVPEMALVAPRDTLTRFAETKGTIELAEYHQTKNRFSLDGIEAPLPKRSVDG